MVKTTVGCDRCEAEAEVSTPGQLIMGGSVGGGDFTNYVTHRTGLILPSGWRYVPKGGGGSGVSHLCPACVAEYERWMAGNTSSG